MNHCWGERIRRFLELFQFCQNFFQVFNSICGFLEACFLGIGQLDFDDFLNAALAQFYGNADEQVIETVFTFQICRTRNNFV